MILPDAVEGLHGPEIDQEVPDPEKPEEKQISPEELDRIYTLRSALLPRVYWEKK